MFCPACGAKNDDNARFCFSCGHSLENVKQGGGRQLAADQQSMVDLVDRAKKGDTNALTQIYEETFNDVVHVAFVLVKNRDTALDIAQSTYLKAWEHFDQLEDANALKAWLRSIANHTAKDWLKKTKPLLFDDLKNSDLDSDDDASIEETFEDHKKINLPEEVIDGEESKRLIYKILDDIPEDQRMAIGLFYYENMSVKSIAESLDISESAVKSRLAYGRKKIKNAVLELEKQGTKLYGLTAIPFLVFLFKNMDAQAAEVPDSEILHSLLTIAKSTPAIGAGAGTTAGATAAETTGAAEGSAAAVSATVGAKSAIGGAGVRIAVLAAAGAIATGGVIAYTVVHNKGEKNVPKLIVEHEISTIYGGFSDLPSFIEEAAYQSSGVRPTEKRSGGTSFLYDYTKSQDGLSVTEEIAIPADEFDFVQSIEYAVDDNGYVTGKTFVDDEISYDYAYEYDEKKQVVAVTASSAADSNYLRSYAFEYDDAGNIISSSYTTNDDETPILITYAYDENGNLLSRTTKNNSELDGTVSETTYSFLYEDNKISEVLITSIIVGRDDSEQRYEIFYDKKNRLSQIVTPHGSDLEYTYDKHEKIEQMPMSDVSAGDVQDLADLDKQYNAALTGEGYENFSWALAQITAKRSGYRMKSLLSGRNASDEKIYSYDKFGNIAGYKHGNEEVTYTLDGFGNVTYEQSSEDGEGSHYLLTYNDDGTVNTKGLVIFYGDGSSEIMNQLSNSYKYGYSNGKITSGSVFNEEYEYDEQGYLVRVSEARPYYTRYRIYYDSNHMPLYFTGIAIAQSYRTFGVFRYDENGCITVVQSETFMPMEQRTAASSTISYESDIDNTGIELSGYLSQDVQRILDDHPEWKVYDGDNTQLDCEIASSDADGTYLHFTYSPQYIYDVTIADSGENENCNLVLGIQTGMAYADAKEMAEEQGFSYVSDNGAGWYNWEKGNLRLSIKSAEEATAGSPVEGVVLIDESLVNSDAMYNLTPYFHAHNAEPSEDVSDYGDVISELKGSVSNGINWLKAQGIAINDDAYYDSYAIVDLNNDGLKEMIIGETWDEWTTDVLLTRDADGNLHQIEIPWTGNYIYYCENGRIVCDKAVSAFDESVDLSLRYYIVYTIDTDTYTLKKEKEITLQPTENLSDVYPTIDLDIVDFAD